MSDKVNVLVICGSLRKGSYNAAVARALPALAPPELNLTPAPSFEKFPIYNVDVHNAGVPADVTAWCAAIGAADGVIIVSPEYNWSIPGGLKNALDWASKVKELPFTGKPVAIQSAAGGPLGGARMQYHLRMSLMSIDAITFAKPEIFVSFAAKKVNDQGELSDEPTKEIIGKQLAGFAKFIKKMKG